MTETTEELLFVKEGELNKVQYYILRNNKNELRMIEKENYQSFNLKPGMTLMGRIRKKGCAGEAIAELLHPDYICGETYLFYIVRTGSVNLNDTVVHFIEVSQSPNLKFTIKVNDTSTYHTGDKVLCILKEQDQGRLIFSVKQ